MFLQVRDEVVGFVHRHAALVVDEERNPILATESAELLMGLFVARLAGSRSGIVDDVRNAEASQRLTDLRRVTTSPCLAEF